MRLLRCTGGTAAIETALVLPVFLLGIVGVMEGGHAIWIQNTLQRAVEAAARCATVDTVTCSSSSAVQSYAASQATGMSVPANTFAVTTPACGNQVVATYTYTFLTSVLPLPSLTLSAQACMPK